MNKFKLPLILSLVLSITISCQQSIKEGKNPESEEKDQIEAPAPEVYVDSLAYFTKVNSLINGDTTGLWPVVEQPLPLNGAILPFKRIIAYYGNLYSKRMGALGEYAPEEMWSMLKKELRNWEEADPNTPVVPALHYIAVVAQGDAGADGMYRFRMPDHQIDSVLNIAKMVDSTLVFLDIQVGLSTIEKELPHLEKYLKLPHVHLGIDPEFSMKDGSKPGKRIGVFHAKDFNFCIDYLSNLVKEYNLPPKVFVIHRFTQGMVREYQDIKLTPEVQTVVHMDGWGPPELKKGTYRHFIHKEPVQFTGFKIFYKNDIKNPPHRLLTAEELMQLKPQVSYVQYQ